MRVVLSLTALILAVTPALAQNPQVAPPQSPTVPVAPPNAASPPPEQIAPKSGSLSDSLSRQRGTIKPPQDVDPGMAVAPKNSGRSTTPVIPPPGSPGGNQSVVPK
jgi:hypothetical protein